MLGLAAIDNAQIDGPMSHRVYIRRVGDDGELGLNHLSLKNPTSASLTESGGKEKSEWLTTQYSIRRTELKDDR